MAKVSFGSRAASDSVSAVSEAVVAATKAMAPKVAEMVTGSSFPSYSRSDMGKIVNEDGILKVIRSRLAEGHTKIVTRDRLTESFWLGVLPSDTDVTAVDKDFAYFVDPDTGKHMGFFTYRVKKTSTTGTWDGATDWYPYDPFNPDGVDAPIGNDGDAGQWKVDPSSTAVWTEALVFGGVAKSQADFEEKVTDPGQAWIALDSGHVYYASDITPAAKDEIHYYAEDMVPVLVNNPVAVLWGKQQTSRTANELTNQDEAPSGTTVQKYTLLQWKHEEDFFGGGIDVDILSSSEAPSDADGRPSTASKRGHIYFKLPAGLYRFSGVFKTGILARSAQARIYKAKSGDDELLAESSSASYNNVVDGPKPDTASVMEMGKTPPIRLEDSDVLYVTEGKTSTSALTTSHYLEIEYCGH